MVIYFDQSSFNVWLRNRRTWSTADRPVKMPIKKDRLHGITVFGAVGEQMTMPVFMQATSTNWQDTIRFLKLLREAEPSDSRLYMVADNHRAHYKAEVQEEADRLNIEFVFLPSGTPELNSIESLWGVIKRDFKSRLIMNKLVTIS